MSGKKEGREAGRKGESKEEVVFIPNSSQSLGGRGEGEKEGRRDCIYTQINSVCPASVNRTKLYN